jgi:hypothetical protein
VPKEKRIIIGHLKERSKMDIEKKIRDLEEEQAGIKKRLAILEAGCGMNGKTGDKTIELDLVLPAGCHVHWLLLRRLSEETRCR